VGHGVLPVAEAGQDARQEGFQRSLGLIHGGRPTEIVQIAEMIGKQARNVGDRALRRGRRDCAQPRWRAESLGQLLAVLSVEVPATAFGIGALHQQARLAAHLAIEILHPQLALISRPSSKTGMRTDEAPVLADIDGQSAGRGERREGFGQPDLARLGDHDAGIGVVGQGAVKFADDGLRVARGVDADIANGCAARRQPFRVGAHGGEPVNCTRWIVGAWHEHLVRPSSIFRWFRGAFMMSARAAYETDLPGLATPAMNGCRSSASGSRSRRPSTLWMKQPDDGGGA